MSGSAKVEDVSSAIENVSSAIEESARLVGAAYSRDRVRPILTAYGDALAEAGIIFSVTTGTRELEYTITVPPGGDDPYALALSNGFVAETDHPVGALLSDIQGRCSISEYLIDCGVIGGFKKIYSLFPPDDMQELSKLADIPSMPRGLAENAGFFARHGLHDVAMTSIDYQRRTVNLYFSNLSAECVEQKTILSMLREIGLPEPNKQMLEFVKKSLRIYVTLGWDSSKIERISFAPPPSRRLITSDLSTLPARIGPEIEQFVRSAPHTYAGERILILAVKWSPDGEYLDFGSYYQLSPTMRKIWMAIHKEQV